MLRGKRTVKSAEDLKRAKALRHFFIAEAEQHLKRYGAHSIGFGPKKRKGKRTGDLSVRVYVPRGGKPKRDPNCDDVESSLTLKDPDTGDEFSYITDVSTAPLVRLQGVPHDARANNRIAGGVSCGGDVQFGGSPGTLGGWTWDRIDQRIALLSAEHVLGIFNPSNPPPVFVPGVGGPEKKRVGHVLRSQGLAGPDISVDCAIATFDLDRALLEVLEIGPAVMAVAGAEVDLPVEKYGFTTDHTKGVVINPYWTGYLDPDVPNVEAVLARGCIKVEAPRGQWSQKGDSGSLVFAREPLNGSSVKPVIGLHFAGDPGDPDETAIGIACPIDEVFRRLNIDTLSAGLVELLAVRALPNQEVSQAAVLLRGLSDLVPAAGPTKPVHQLLVRHKAEIVDLLLRDVRLRNAAARALKAVVQDARVLNDILEHRISDDEVKAIGEFARELKELASAELRLACDALVQMAERIQGSTISQILRPRGSRAKPPVRGPSSTAASEAQIREYLAEHERDVQLLREYGAEEVYVDNSNGAPVLVFAFRGTQPLKTIPRTLVWERGVDVSVNIPTRSVGARRRRPKVKR